MEPNRIIVIGCIALLLSACGPSLDDAKKLGFDSVEEMKQIQSLGYQNKDLWNAHQTELKDLKFANEHGFETIDGFNAYRAASPQQKVVISAKNAIKRIPYEEFIKCGAANEAAVQVFYTDKNKPLGDSEQAIRGMYNILKTEYLSQGKNASDIDNALVSAYSKLINRNDYDEISESAVKCMDIYKPYFAAAEIDGYKVGIVETANASKLSSAPQPPRQSPQAAGDISSLKRGSEYNYYANSPCTDKCVTKQQAEKLCGELSGSNQYMWDLLTNGGALSERDSTILKNTTPSFSTTWNGSSCRGKISASGLYKGTSTRVDIDGAISGFYITDSGKVLANYIDTFR